MIALFISCSDSPSSVGGGLIQDQDKISFTQLDTYTQDVKQTSYTYEPAIFKIGSGGKLILGRTSYAESKILLTFDLGLPDSSWTKFKNNTTDVHSARVTFKTSYLLGDKNLPFDFTVKQVRTPWSMYTIDKDSLPSLTNDNVDVSYNHTFTDTTISFDLNKTVIKEWLTAKLDTNNTRNYGIIITPTNNTQKMRGFINPFSSTTDYALLSFVMDRIPSTAAKDTLTVVPYTGTFIVTELQKPVANYLTLQSGYSHRNFMSFDLSKLPKNIIVSKALLELTNESTKSTDGDPSSTTVLVSILADSSTKKYTSDSLYTSSLTKSNQIYSGDISWIIQKWCQGADNQGMELVLSDEHAAVSRIAFYGSSESDKTKRPRLKIYYIQK
jgi:hypothetical protein